MKQKRLNQKLFNVLSYIIKKEVCPQNTVTFFREVDCEIIERIRLQYSMQNKKKPSYTAFIIKAISKATRDYPFVNARVFPGLPYSKIVKFPEITTAVACEQNLPGAEFFSFFDLLKNTDQKTIDEINLELLQLAKADLHNNKQLRSFINVIKYTPTFLARFLCCTLPTCFPYFWKKFRGAGIVISSPSKYGVDSLVATWTHPIGISFGLIQKKAIVKNNKAEIAKCFTLTLNFDRRIIAGAPAAKFLNTIATNLMDQEFLAQHLEEDFLMQEKSIEKITAIA